MIDRLRQFNFQIKAEKKSLVEKVNTSAFSEEQLYVAIIDRIVRGDLSDEIEKHLKENFNLEGSILSDVKTKFIRYIANIATGITFAFRQESEKNKRKLTLDEVLEIVKTIKFVLIKFQYTGQVIEEGEKTHLCVPVKDNKPGAENLIVWVNTEFVYKKLENVGESDFDKLRIEVHPSKHRIEVTKERLPFSVYLRLIGVEEGDHLLQLRKSRTLGMKLLIRASLLADSIPLIRKQSILEKMANIRMKAYLKYIESTSHNQT